MAANEQRRRHGHHRLTTARVRVSDDVVGGSGDAAASSFDDVGAER